MARVIMLVSAEGATLPESKADDLPGDNHAIAALLEEARVSGCSEEEVQKAKGVVVGDF